MKTEKPIFIPLKTEYFLAFQRGEKSIEFRLYGARWNEQTCRRGRAVTLSKGYGKSARLSGVVSKFTRSKLEDLSPTYQASLKRLFGDIKTEIACIHIELD